MLDVSSLRGALVVVILFMVVGLSMHLAFPFERAVMLVDALVIGIAGVPSAITGYILWQTPRERHNDGSAALLWIIFLFCVGLGLARGWWFAYRIVGSPEWMREWQMWTLVPPVVAATFVFPVAMADHHGRVPGKGWLKLVLGVGAITTVVLVAMALLIMNTPISFWTR